MERNNVISWSFKQTPQQVWECLTDPELLGQWFMKNDFKAEVGHQFNFINKPMPAVGWDRIVYAEVMEVDSAQKLVYSWKAGPRPGVINMDTVLIWTLTPHNGGTLLKLEHKGFKGIKNYLSSFIMEKGWQKNISVKFQRVLNAHTNGKA
jgi:uncharacterized protein YndB with AHSA1/START domain